jgi:hypothetical protein
VTGVQRAHGGNQANRVARVAAVARPLAQFVYGAKNFHQSPSLNSIKINL